MPRRTAYRRQRRRFFVACEGDSEVGYAAFISLLAEESGLAVHLDIRRCRGGDPLAVVVTAVSELQTRRRRHGPYAGQAIFLDADRRDDAPGRTTEADQLIRNHGFCAVWSQPTLEAVLLRHLRGCQQSKPATATLALRRLQDCWPGYRKGMAARELRDELDLAAVVRAAAVMPELRKFLIAIGLLV